MEEVALAPDLQECVDFAEMWKGILSRSLSFIVGTEIRGVFTFEQSTKMGKKGLQARLGPPEVLGLNSPEGKWIQQMV